MLFWITFLSQVGRRSVDTRLRVFLTATDEEELKASLRLETLAASCIIFGARDRHIANRVKSAP